MAAASASVGCVADDFEATSSLSMALEMPAAVAAADLELTVLDEGASCVGLTAEGGSELTRVKLVPGESNRIRISAGFRVFSVVAYEDSLPIARGCNAAMLTAGDTHQVEIEIVEMNGGADGGPGTPDAGLPDSGPPDDPPVDGGSDDPPGDDCDEPGPLAEGSPTSGSTADASDDYQLSCLVSSAPDTVHELTLNRSRSVLVTLTPTGNGWSPAVALRSADACSETSAELACTASGFDRRYLTYPYLSAGTYDLIVDGSDSGSYEIEYDTRPPDSGFGYWKLERSEPYMQLNGGTTVPGFSPGGGTGEDSWTVDLPFPFDFYGSSYLAVTISANMYLTFGVIPNGRENSENDCSLDSSAPNAMIALFWDNAFAPASAPAASLKTKVEGTAPNRRFIIELRNWDFEECKGNNCTPQKARLTQQAVLHENGDIELRYGPRIAPQLDNDCGPTRHLGCSATIGIEDPTGTDANMAACNTNAVGDGTVFYFVHP